MYRIGCDKLKAGTHLKLSVEQLLELKFKKIKNKNPNKTIYRKTVGTIEHAYKETYRCGKWQPYYTITLNPNIVLFNTNTILCNNNELKKVLNIVNKDLFSMHILPEQHNFEDFDIIRMDACLDYHVNGSNESQNIIDYMKTQLLPYTKAEQKYTTTSYHKNKKLGVVTYNKNLEVISKIKKRKATPEDIRWSNQKKHTTRLEVQYKKGECFNEKYNTRKVRELFNFNILLSMIKDTIINMNLHKTAHNKGILFAKVESSYTKTKASNKKRHLEQWNNPNLCSNDKRKLWEKFDKEFKMQNFQFSFASLVVLKFLKELKTGGIDALPFPFKNTYAIYQIKNYIKKIINLYFYEDGGG